jgi:hypothetical protein
VVLMGYTKPLRGSFFSENANTTHKRHIGG